MSGLDGLFHGGVPGLRPGDLLVGGSSRRSHDGCPFCEARARGEGVIIDGHVVDGPSSYPDRVYVTTDRCYGRFYASLYGYGDLYRVEPVGEMVPSAEDHFPTWTVAQARVRSVVERAVLLSRSQRRQMLKRWTAADLTAAGGAA